jgi:hypothetical protein
MEMTEYVVKVLSAHQKQHHSGDACGEIVGGIWARAR